MLLGSDVSRDEQHSGWQELGITQPGVCRAVRRGEEFAVSENLEFLDKRNS